jgi:predicted RNA-binding protein with PUA-like domain
MLYWVRKNEPDTYLYEMIQTSDDGQKRSRVWQWIRDGETRLRTLIDERKVSNVWADATAPCG